MTRSSMRIGIHRAADTPDQEAIKGFRAGNRGAVWEEGHLPRSVRVRGGRSSRPVVVVRRRHILKRMAGRERSARRNAWVQQAHQLHEGRKAPPSPTADGFVCAQEGGTNPSNLACTR